MQAEVAAHTATLDQMNTRIGSIETRLEAKPTNALVIGLTIGMGAWVSLNMALLAWLAR